MDEHGPRPGTDPDASVTTLINEFLDRRQAGEPLTAEAFLDVHPEGGDALRTAIAGLSVIDAAWQQHSRTSGGDASSGTCDQPLVPGYQLIAELGRGGMGVVYQAVQISTRRHVALKVMLAGPFASADARQRFKREVQLSARLAHQNIVRVLESGEIAGQPYCAMEYVDGVRLDRHCAETQIDRRGLLELFAQICAAVEYAHAHGVVHRDLKPANVLVDGEGRPNILDFGLARALDQVESSISGGTRLSAPGQVLGTPAYMAPEQAAGTPEQSDARTDVYALGLMLCELLTGRLPYDTRGRPSEIIERIVAGMPAAPSQLVSSIDADLDTIVLKALEKEKSRRYASAAAMAEDVRRYLAGEPLLARRRSRVYVLRKRLRKHWLPLTAASVLVVAVAGGLVYRAHARRTAEGKARLTAFSYLELLERRSDGSGIGAARVLYHRHPNLIEVRLVWAREQFQADRPDAAIRFLEARLRQDPAEWASRRLLADMYTSAGDAERGRRLRAEAEQQTPDTARAWLLRSLATLDPAEALRCVRRCVELEPTRAIAWVRAAHLSLCTGDFEAALEAADHLVALDESAARWIAYRGHILARQGRFREAVTHYNRTIELDADSPAPFIYRAHAYRGLRDYARAVDDYTTALELRDPRSANIWYYYQRATPLLILGRPEEALDDYQRFRVLRGRPSYSDARSFIILHDLGRSDEAQELMAAALQAVDSPSWLRRILLCLSGELAPDALIADAVVRDDREQRCEAYYYAGESWRLRGELEQARQCFQQCVDTGVAFDLDDFPLTPMNEFELAEWRLATLPTGTPAPQP